MKVLVILAILLCGCANNSFAAYNKLVTDNEGSILDVNGTEVPIFWGLREDGAWDYVVVLAFHNGSEWVAIAAEDVSNGRGAILEKEEFVLDALSRFAARANTVLDTHFGVYGGATPTDPKLIKMQQFRDVMDSRLFLQDNRFVID